MKRLLVCGLVCLVAVAFSGIAMAGSQDDAKIALHVGPHVTTKSGGCNAPEANGQYGCDSPNETSNLNVTVPSAGGDLFDAFMVVVDADPGAGIAGATMGVEYSGSVFMSGWTLCADLEFPGNGWPDSGGGNVITFDAGLNCQNAPDPTDPQLQATAVLGFFYVYTYAGPGELGLTKRNYIPTPDFAVADCAAAESALEFPLYAGRVGFGGTEGYQPCVQAITPVEETTWGGVKNQFSGE